MYVPTYNCLREYHFTSLEFLSAKFSSETVKSLKMFTRAKSERDRDKFARIDGRFIRVIVFRVFFFLLKILNFIFVNLYTALTGTDEHFFVFEDQNGQNRKGSGFAGTHANNCTISMH